VLLQRPGKGRLVPCDFAELIEAILVAPDAPPYYADAVQYLVKRNELPEAITITPSRMLSEPDY
jgi:hypothetical protein